MTVLKLNRTLLYFDKLMMLCRHSRTGRAGRAGKADANATVLLQLLYCTVQGEEAVAGSLAWPGLEWIEIRWSGIRSLNLPSPNIKVLLLYP